MVGASSNRLIPIVLALLMLSAIGCAADQEPTRPQLSVMAEKIDGELIDVGPLLAEDTLLWFWAPW